MTYDLLRRIVIELSAWHRFAQLEQCSLSLSTRLGVFDVLPPITYTYAENPARLMLVINACHCVV